MTVLAPLFTGVLVASAGAAYAHQKHYRKAIPHVVKHASVTILAATLFLACYAGAAPADLAPRQVLHRGNGAEPQTLDPHKAEAVTSLNILRDLYEGLVAEAPDGNVAPGVAERWEIDRGGRQYLFHLRADARWSNGDPVTAQDFVAGMRRAVDPATGSRYSQVLSPILHAEDILAGRKPVSVLGVTATAERTLRIVLKAPTPYFLGLLTHSSTYPIHRGSLARHGERFTRPGKLISNGAYMLKDWVVHSHITLQRNRYYWNDDHTVIDAVHYYPIEERAAEFKRYRAGGLDWTEAIPLNQYRWIKRHLAGELVVAPYLGSYFYGFNLTRPPFMGNRALRRALSMAIDREVITEKLTAAGEAPAYGWIPPGIKGYRPQSLPFQKLSNEARLVRARDLYRQAGYSDVSPLQVEIRYNTGENHKRLAVAIAAMWKKHLGVRTTLVNEEWKVFLASRARKSVTQVFRAGWIGDYNDPYTFAQLFHSRNRKNDTGYADPEYDRLLQRASVETDPKVRNGLLQEAEQKLLAEHAIIPIYFYVYKRLIKPYVRGYRNNILDHHYTKHLYIAKHL